MSTLPLILSLANDLESWPHHYDDDFGLGIYPHQINNLRRNHPRLGLHSLNRLSEATSSQRCTGKTTSAIGKDGFQVCIDVQQYKPNELVVKTVDNCVIVEGKHEEREDEHGYISRHFVRRYTLPQDYDPAHVTSALSSDGVLTIKGPVPSKSISNERLIQIQHTGPAHLSVKENPKVETGNKNEEDKKKE